MKLKTCLVLVPLFVFAFPACGSKNKGSSSHQPDEHSRRQNPPLPHENLVTPAIASGEGFTCFLNKEKAVYCWGTNNNGQLGHGIPNSSFTPVRVKGLPPVKSITAAFEHACAVTLDGKAYCWGRNSSYQLGNGKQQDSFKPVQVPNLSQVESISASANHTCAIQEGGTLWCWGDNTQGQLGVGQHTLQSRLPIQINSPLKFKSVSASNSRSSFGYTCAITQQGELYCWGTNSHGQLGHPVSHPPAPQYTPIKSPNGLYADSVWTSISGGGAHNCGVESSGKVICWGDNAYHQLASDNRTHRGPEPKAISDLQHIKRISSGVKHTCVVNEDDSVSCWGYNENSQCGQDAKTKLISGPYKIPGLTHVVDIVASSEHTCAVSQDDSVYCWGSNNHDGRLGVHQGLHIESDTPIKVEF